MKLRCTLLEPREMPAVLSVTSNLDNLFADNDLTLREAIRTVNAGNTDLLSTTEKTFVSGTLGTNDFIQFVDSLSGATITIGAPGVINITRPVSISGPASLPTTLDGANTYSILNINLPGTTSAVSLRNLGFTKAKDSAVTTVDNLVVDSCVFTNNITSSNGGAIYNLDGKLTVRSSTFTGNTATNITSLGGAIAVRTSSSSVSDANASTITNSSFANNSAAQGGAVSVDFIQNVRIVSSTFTGNTSVTGVASGLGGAVYNRSIVSLFHNIFDSNVADFGGALWSGITASSSGDLFTNNKAVNGGAIYIGNTTTFSIASTFNATNTTISGNKADNNGGGIVFDNSFYSGSGTVGHRLVNVSVVGNRSRVVAANTGTGGGIRIADSKTNLQIYNSIVAGNTDKAGTDTPNDIAGTIFSSSPNNVIGDSATAAGLTNGNQNNIVGINGTGTRPIATILNPTLTGTGSQRTHALVQNSLAIGAGSATVPGYVAYDQREAPRGINADAPDIGAYEVQHPLTPVGVPQTYARTFQPKPSATQNEAFIKGLYQSTLLRAAEPAGLQGWLDIMNAGTLTIQQIAYGFVNSTENRNNQVAFFYRYFLNREPDIAGLNFHVNRLQTGVDEAQVMSEFILSAEYSASSTNADFVNLMYYAILGRQADSAGYNGWLNSLNGGTSRATVVNAFVRSPEGITRIVNSYFASYLKRNATAGELDQFNGLVNSQTFGITASQILGTTEFLTAAGQNLT
jgi:predicted outer membrane repeat protein